MGLFTIDRTINFSEEKVKKVLSIIFSSSTVEEIENKMVAQGVVNLQPDTNRHGFFKRRWVTFLKDFDLYNGQTLSEVGQLYLKNELSTKELLFLLLIRRTVIVNNTVLRPFEQILRISNKLRSLGYSESITRGEFEKYVAIVGMSDEWNVEFVTNLIIEDRNGNSSQIDANPGPVHFDIWKNLMVTAGLALEGDDIKIDFNNPTIQTIITFFDDVQAVESEFGIFNDEFVKYINISVNVRNNANTLLNDSLIKYQGILKSKLKYSNLQEDLEEGSMLNMIEYKKINYKTGYHSDFARNRILFGAPGTGKSFTLNGDRKELLYGDRAVDEDSIDRSQYGEYERVTFHPDYSYANFVGTYKPVPCKDDQGHDAITYSYVPGPFVRTYVKALLNSRTDSPKPYLLVIEEINRANVAAVFGDVFQLLDRDDDEVSEYAIQASEDIKKYLAEKLGGDPEEYAEIRIPDNMFIWATMNSADQGVFPMDTAFKRRWDFTYLGIDDSEDGIKGKTVVLGEGQYKRVVEWNALRQAINNELLTYKVNEDKLMGPYFISKKNLPEGTEIDVKTFTRIFKNKVIMYLFDDAAKQKRLTLFGGCDEKSKSQYSKICSEFDKKGVYIFCEAIHNQFIDCVPTNETAEEDAE